MSCATPADAAAALLLGVAALGLLAESGSFAFDAADANNRASSAEVVAAGAAYHAVSTLVIHASTSDGYDAQDGVTARNDGAASATLAWTTESDPDGVVASLAQCSAPTPVGSTCTVRFSGPAKPAGTYTFSGRVEGTALDLRSRMLSISVNVTYCASPPCP